MHNKLLNLFVLLIFLAGAAYPQVDTADISNSTLDDLLEDPADDANENNEKYEIVEALISNPININTADVFELQKIPYIDLNLAELIIKFRNKYGHIFSLKELQKVSGFSEDLLNKISAFICFTERNSFEIKSFSNADYWSIKANDIRLNFRNRTYEDLQRRKGFIDNYYLGSPVKVYNRLQFNCANRFGIDLLIEKDQGEKRLNDFSSFSIWLKDYSFLKTFVAGDYTLAFGQGLLLWGPYAEQKGSNLSGSVIRRSNSLRPYSGSNEYNYLRGTAADFNFGNFNAIPFYSQKYFDGGIDSLDNIITSISIDGYHRTLYEIANMNNSYEKIYGINLNYSIKDLLNIGSTYYHSSFSMPVEYNNNQLRQLFNCYSVYYDINYKNIEIAGEQAFSEKYSAGLHNLQIFISDELNFISSVRYYPPGYINLHGLGFGENTNICNETGFYTGLNFTGSFGRINFFFDIIKFPSSSYGNIFPSQGKEFYLRFISRRFSNANFIFRYKYSLKDFSLPYGLFDETSGKNNHNFRLELRNRLKHITLQSRLEFFFTSPTTSNKHEKGMLIMEGIKFSPFNFIDAACRFMLFKTDSFYSSIYEYEDDFKGIIRSYALYGDGLRWYLLLKIKPLKIISVTLKYSETYKPGQKTLGSGYSLINGNLDNQVGLQLDFNL